MYYPLSVPNNIECLHLSLQILEDKKSITNRLFRFARQLINLSSCHSCRL